MIVLARKPSKRSMSFMLDFSDLRLSDGVYLRLGWGSSLSRLLCMELCASL